MTSDPVAARARELLAADRATTLARLGDLEADVALIVEASQDSNADDEHDPEGATIAFERAQTSALASSAVAHLREITAAEARLDDGTYGVCERCGDAIPAGRLEARPTARTCVAHAACPR
ncbi:TraR/DksA C4-type zinc finger protein [Pedococcus aerophilus]|uniref:TraR/DksA C4-type zinc finger protein n=1 Tax=Pedococcus aerophilus TaxID=436356 RepID=A0ABN3UUL7_9MICO